MVALKAIHEWLREPGALVSWEPTPATRQKALQAPASAVPASYQQAQHLRSQAELSAKGVDFARLVIAAFDIPGRCDMRTMSYVVNAHLRRHDTYRNWFEYHDEDHITRHTIANPADIKFVPVKRDELSTTQLREQILATPDPLQWDCFRFGIIQRADHFTFYASVDHLHMDPVMVSVVFVEIFAMYNALHDGGAPLPLPATGSYDEYCIRQREYTSALTLDSPEVGGWIQFAENNGGSLPRFPLPLEDTTAPGSTGALLTVQLMDGAQTNRFEAACVQGGARLSGGMWACAALADYELTGAETFYVVTPTDTRSTQAEMVTSGWFTGLIPITVAVDPESFAETARAAQQSFDSGAAMAHVPFDRVLDLAPWLNKPGPGVRMLSFLDTGMPPLSPMIMAQIAAMNGGVFSDGRFSAQLNMWVTRQAKETTLTVLFPENPVARDSISRYVETLQSICARVAAGRGVALAGASRAS
jgi:mycolipenoyl-CoA---2-(long-chain-fatty acyl)-trehalose mycolipenoyltransferase / long-chain-acyl-CoA---trehalose acyltransferase